MARITMGDRLLLFFREYNLRETENGSKLRFQTEHSISKEKAPIDTRFLQEQIVSRYSPLTAMVHAQASYSAYQEFGTRFMSAQPYMKPALLWVQPKYQKDMTDVMKGVFE